MANLVKSEGERPKSKPQSTTTKKATPAAKRGRRSKRQQKGLAEYQVTWC